MSIGITAYRTLSILLFVLLIAALVFATDGRVTAAIFVLIAMLAVVLTQSAMLRCHYCGARPGLWILIIWTLLLDPVLYLADALFLRECPKCGKPLSVKKSQTDSDAVNNRP